MVVHTLVIPALTRKRQEDCHDFKASLGYVLKLQLKTKSQIMHFTFPKISLYTFKMLGGWREKL